MATLELEARADSPDDDLDAAVCARAEEAVWHRVKRSLEAFTQRRTSTAGGSEVADALLALGGSLLARFKEQDKTQFKQ